MTAVKENKTAAKQKNDSSNYQRNGGNIGPSGPWAFPSLGLFWAHPLCPPSWAPLVPTLGPFLGLSMDRSCFNHDPILSLMTGPPRIIALHELRG